MTYAYEVDNLPFSGFMSIFGSTDRVIGRLAASL